METNVVDERGQSVRDFASGHWSLSELCERYGVSRPSGYKWLARYRAEGEAGLLDSSRAPQRCPHRTGENLEALGGCEAARRAVDRWSPGGKFAASGRTGSERDQSRVFGRARRPRAAARS